MASGWVSGSTALGHLPGLPNGQSPHRYVHGWCAGLATERRRCGDRDEATRQNRKHGRKPTLTLSLCPISSLERSLGSNVITINYRQPHHQWIARICNHHHTRAQTLEHHLPAQSTDRACACLQVHAVARGKQTGAAATGPGYLEAGHVAGGVGAIVAGIRLHGEGCDVQRGRALAHRVWKFWNPTYVSGCAGE